MFEPRNFLKKNFLRNVGRVADAYIADRAKYWNEKGILTEEDLAEIDAKIEAQHSANIAEDIQE